MTSYREKLDRFMERNGIEPDRIERDYAVGELPEGTVKTILLVDRETNLHSATLRADEKVRRDPLKRHMDARDLHMLPEGEIEERTGYPVGGVPPFGYDAEFAVDEELTGEVYAGGGEPGTMVRVRIEDIVRVTGADRLSFARRKRA